MRERERREREDIPSPFECSLSLSLFFFSSLLFSLSSFPLFFLLPFSILSSLLVALSSLLSSLDPVLSFVSILSVFFYFLYIYRLYTLSINHSFLHPIFITRLNSSFLTALYHPLSSRPFTTLPSSSSSWSSLLLPSPSPLSPLSSPCSSFDSNKTQTLLKPLRTFPFILHRFLFTLLT